MKQEQLTVNNAFSDVNCQRLLAIDTFAQILSIAVISGEEIYYAETEEGMKHSELVMDYIDALMKSANLKPCDLQGVLCMGGPGSFTGLRIGWSIAKGLALSLSIPFAPVPTLDCIAYQRTVNKEQRTVILALVESRKNSYYYAFFKDGKRLTPDKDADSAQIGREIKNYEEKIVLTGHGSGLFFNSLGQEEKQNLILKSEKRGYAKEIIYTALETSLRLAQNRNIFDNDHIAYLYSGPEYIRLTDAEAALGLQI